MGSNVSRPTSRTSFSVISANASAALLCRSTLSLKDNVDNARRGSPVKKLVSDRSVGSNTATSAHCHICDCFWCQLTFEVLEKVCYSVSLIV